MGKVAASDVVAKPASIERRISSIRGKELVNETLASLVKPDVTREVPRLVSCSPFEGRLTLAIESRVDLTRD